MLGAVLGDIVGSVYERYNVKTKDFPLRSSRTRWTDDTVMTLAVAQWLMDDPTNSAEHLVHCMQQLGRAYPKAGYGGSFRNWLMSSDPQPYNSWGNGSAMRVSPVSLYATSLNEALELAKLTACVTHNHPEGIKGAMAVAECVYLNKNRCEGRDNLDAVKEHIKKVIPVKYGYNLNRTLDEIRPQYTFDVSCQGSVPEAIIAFLESDSLENCLRNAISIGGDSDTIAAIACSIFAAHPDGWDLPLMNSFAKYLPGNLASIMEKFERIVFPVKPILNSYKVCEQVYAGEYPRDLDDTKSIARMKQFERFGITHFIDLTEEGELRPYNHLLAKDMHHLRFPIPDVSTPQSTDLVHDWLKTVKDILDADPKHKVYIHCWGGVGRTGVIVACLLAEMYGLNYQQTMDKLKQLFQDCSKSAYRNMPETREQCAFIAKYIDDNKIITE